MNRFKITRESFKKTIQFLAGKLNKSAAPKYAQRFGPELTVKGDKIFYKTIPLIPIEDRNDFYRSNVYTRGSITPMNRDQGFSALSKLGWNLTRRSWHAWLKSQTKLRSTDRAPAEPKKKGGRPARDLNTTEADLLEIRTSQMPRELKHIKNQFVLTVVHRVSSLTRLILCKDKEPNTVTPKLIEAIEWICKQVGTEVRKARTVTDSGFEFDSERLRKRGIKHIVQRLGHSVESRNGVARRTLFKVLAKKVGGIQASLQQTQDILNNMAMEKVHKGKTPNEIAKTTHHLRLRPKRRQTDHR